MGAQSGHPGNGFSDPAMVESIPVRIYRDFVVVAQGSLGGGRERLNFVLDTGTAPSIINKTVVERLERLATNKSSVNTMGKAVVSQSAVVAEVDLGPIRAISLPVQIQDLGRLERDLGIAVAGIIGLDVLSKCDFRLDYRNKSLTFGNSPENGIPVPLDPRSGIAVAQATLNGKPVRMLVDTGSDRVILLGEGLKGKDGPASRKMLQEPLSAADPARGVRVLFASRIALGARQFTLEKAYFLPGADGAFDGVLGVRALGFGAIAYRRASRALYLQN